MDRVGKGAWRRENSVEPRVWSGGVPSPRWRRLSPKMRPPFRGTKTARRRIQELERSLHRQDKGRRGRCRAGTLVIDQSDLSEGKGRERGHSQW